jgi:CreA protein
MYGSLALIFWMSACERTPSKVNTQDLEAAAVTGKMKTLCRGLEMRDDDVRRYAAEKLDMVTEPIAAECICSTLTAGPGAEKLGWDPAIVDGLKRTSRDDLAGCVVAVAKRSDLKERLRAVSTMTSMTAPVARQALIDIAVEAIPDPEVQGVVCHVAYFNRSMLDRLQQGNWFEDPSYSAVDCSASGPITVGDINLNRGGEEIFKQNRSLIWKSLRVSRIYDATNNSLVYLAHARELQQGSGKMSLSVVPLNDAQVTWTRGAPQGIAGGVAPAQ